MEKICVKIKIITHNVIKKKCIKVKILRAESL